jgi:hypothetical protein
MRGLSLPFLGILGAVEAFISDNADLPAICQQPKQNNQRSPSPSLSTLELAVDQATQYKLAIFFKNGNRSETTLGVLILLWVLLYSKKWRLHVKARHARTAGETWHSNVNPIFVTSDLRMPIC